MKLHVKKNMDHFIKDMFSDIMRAQSLIKSDVEYEGLFQIVAAELRAAKYCWDEMFKKGDDTSEKIRANEYELELRSKIAALMHSANILVEAQHMVEQEYTFSSTEQVLDMTMRDSRKEFEALSELIRKTLQSRDIYLNNKVLKDFFVLWDGGRHMHAFD